MCLLICFSHVRLFVTPQTIAHYWDYRTISSSVHGILQARMLDWVAIPFPRGSSQPRDRTQVSCRFQADSLPSEPPGKSSNTMYIHMCICMYVCICVHTYVHTCMCLCICTYMCVYTCMCLYICSLFAFLTFESILRISACQQLGIFLLFSFIAVQYSLVQYILISLKLPLQ